VPTGGVGILLVMNFSDFTFVGIFAFSFFLKQKNFSFTKHLLSRYPLYLLWRTPPQQDTASIGAKREFLFSGDVDVIITNKKHFN